MSIRVEIKDSLAISGSDTEVQAKIAEILRTAGIPLKGNSVFEGVDKGTISILLGLEGSRIYTWYDR